MAKSGSSKGSSGGNRFHSASTGKFVTPSYAKQHPATTFKESPRGNGSNKAKGK